MRAVLGLVLDPVDKFECRIARSQVAVVEIEGQGRVDVVPDAGDSLIAERPVVAGREGAARGAWVGGAREGSDDPGL